jgi:MFS family permease
MTLLGWGIGDLIGRVVADYLGRKRTMMLAILAYSTMTGLSAFCVGLGLLHGSAFLSGRRHRLRMGDWGIDRVGAVAGPGTRARRRADAMRFRDRIFRGVLRLAVFQA